MIFSLTSEADEVVPEGDNKAGKAVEEVVPEAVDIGQLTTGYCYNY